MHWYLGPVNINGQLDFKIFDKLIKLAISNNDKNEKFKNKLPIFPFMIEQPN